MGSETSNAHRILILDPGDSRGALAAARSLGRAGHEVGVAGPSRGPASWSRMTRRWHPLPTPEDSAGPFVAEVAHLVDRHGYAIVIPGSDPELLALATSWSDIGAVLAAPPRDALIAASDKLNLAELARRAGMATPDTRPVDADELSTARFPLIVKARIHGDPAAGFPARVETELAHTPAEAETHCQTIRDAGLEPLLQEVVTGKLMALSILCEPGGRVVAAVQQLADRIWPARAGVSVRARTERVADELAPRVEALMQDLGWSGLAQLQFVRPQDGAPHLIDLNARIYGSMALSVGAGVDLPVRLVRGLLDGQWDRAPEARVGVRYQWLEGDLRSALEEKRALSGGLSALAYAVGATHSIWSLSDPRPALTHSVKLAQRAARKVRRGD